jgi:hypothetical protein
MKRLIEFTRERRYLHNASQPPFLGTPRPSNRGWLFQLNNHHLAAIADLQQYFKFGEENGAGTRTKSRR